MGAVGGDDIAQAESGDLLIGNWAHDTNVVFRVKGQARRNEETRGDLR